MDSERPSLLRSGALCVAAGSGFLALTHLLRLRPAGASFNDVLTWAAAWGLAACCVWGVAVGAVLVLAAADGPDLLRLCCPAAYRGAVLALAGAAAATGAVAPAHADGWRAPGLDRRMDTSPHPHEEGRGGTSATRLVTVHPGDSLWRLLADRHPGAGVGDLALLVKVAYATNRGVIGADPDLLQPGERLELPDGRSSR